MNRMTEEGRKQLEELIAQVMKDGQARGIAVGIVDSDYYNNPDNEGHMFIKIQNEGKEVLKINKGDRFAQGIFNKFYLVDDDCADKDRTGGFGSTGKGE